jgi:hypothetical protein
MWFRRSELLASFHGIASHQARSSLNVTHPINRPLIKSRKSLERRYFSVIQISISPFTFTLMHQIISWGQSSCRIKIKATIAFYSLKLNTAQKRYTTTERELLSAIKTRKEYKNILSGYHEPIIVFTDHKNNTFNALKASDRVLRTCWLLFLEEYGVTFEYFP